MSASANDLKANRNGSRVFLVGLVLQLVSFLFFTCIYLRFLYTVHRHQPDVWAMDAAKKRYHDWRALAGALLVSCIGILVYLQRLYALTYADRHWQIRSVYRVIELSQGFEGRLSTIEAFFYGLDTLPLFLAIVIYIPFWPGRFMPSTSVQSVPEAESPTESDEKV
jgi:hypothetical protein